MSLLRLVGADRSESAAKPVLGRVDRIDRARTAAALAPLLRDARLVGSLDDKALTALLRDLAFAVVELATGKRWRISVLTEAAGETWEIGLERDGAELLLTVFRPGPSPVVVQMEHPVDFERARRAVLDGMDGRGWIGNGGGDCSDPAAADRPDPGLVLARQQLRSVELGTRAVPSSCAVRVPVTASSGPLAIDAELRLRKPPSAVGATPQLCRADLHALLFQGRVELRVGQAARALDSIHVFVLAEQMVPLAMALLDAEQSGASLLQRKRAGGASFGVQLDRRGDVTVLMGQVGDDAELRRLGPVRVRDFAHAVAAWVRSLVKALVDADRRQGANLRLTALGTAGRELAERMRRQVQGASKLNLAPESYRAFDESQGRQPPRLRGHGVGRLRFAPSWQAAIPGLDLRSVLLCGDRLMVGSSGEICCLERSCGLALWRRAAPRGISIMTPRGLARLAPDGGLVVYDVDDGSTALELQLAPCVGGSASGAVVNVPGLPHLLLVAEGADHLVAVDLDSGEIRWRRALHHRGPLRLKRAGKLVVAAGGQSRLVALDLLSGEELWRYGGGRCCFATTAAIERGELFALGSVDPAAASPAKLVHLDPWSGAVRWVAELPRPVRPLGPPRLCSEGVLIITEDDDRLGLLVLDRESGRLRLDRPGGIGQGKAACLVVDDILIANSERGCLLAIDAADGQLRYRHVFASYGQSRDPADRPQSLQPVLRSGALFVPQSEIYVVRPRDGALLGRLPDELIPDLVRVDERCGVYVGEASGHLAAYEAAPTLTLVSTAT